MSNPHPVKQVRNAGDAMSPRMKAKFSAYVPRVRAVGEALPNTNSCFGKSNIYKPTAMAPVRAGADDHLRHRSLAGGVLC